METQYIDDALPSTKGDLYQTRTQELDLLKSFSNRVRTVKELTSNLNELLEKILEIVECDRGDIMIRDKASNYLKILCAIGPYTGLIPRRVNATEGISARALREKKTQVVTDVQADNDYTKLLEKYPEGTDYGLFL